MAVQYSKAARWRGILRHSRRQLQQRWLESLFIILGLALGVGVFTGTETFVRFMTSMSEASYQSVPELSGITVRPAQLDFFIWDDVTPALAVTDDMVSDAELTMADVLDVKDNVPGVQYIILPNRTWGGSVLAVDGRDATADEADMHVELGFIAPDTLAFTEQEILAGAVFSWSDLTAGRPYVVIEERMAEALFPNMAFDDVIGRTVSLSTLGMSPLWTIVAVVAPDPTEALHVPPEFWQDRWKLYAPAGMDDPLRSFVIIPDDRSQQNDLIQQLTAYFDQRYGPGQVEVREPYDTGESMGAIVALLFLSGLALLIASVNILNLFVARVWRRQRVTGVSVALGATRSMLFWQTAGEALLLGFIGSLLGLFVAAGVIALLKLFYMAMLFDMGGWNPFADLRLTVTDAGIGLLLGTTVSLLFGLYPAFVTSRQQPAEALRHE